MVELPAWEQWQSVWDPELEIRGIVNRERERVSTEGSQSAFPFGPASTEFKQ